MHPDRTTRRLAYYLETTTSIYFTLLEMSRVSRHRRPGAVRFPLPTRTTLQSEGCAADIRGALEGGTSDNLRRCALRANVLG